MATRTPWPKPRLKPNAPARRSWTNRSPASAKPGRSRSAVATPISSPTSSTATGRIGSRKTTRSIRRFARTIYRNGWNCWPWRKSTVHCRFPRPHAHDPQHRPAQSATAAHHGLSAGIQAGRRQLRRRPEEVQQTRPPANGSQPRRAVQLTGRDPLAGPGAASPGDARDPARPWLHDRAAAQRRARGVTPIAPRPDRRLHGQIPRSPAIRN